MSGFWGLAVVAFVFVALIVVVLIKARQGQMSVKNGENKVTADLPDWRSTFDRTKGKGGKT